MIIIYCEIVKVGVSEWNKINNNKNTNTLSGIEEQYKNYFVPWKRKMIVFFTDNIIALQTVRLARCEDL